MKRRIVVHSTRAVPPRTSRMKAVASLLAAAFAAFAALPEHAAAQPPAGTMAPTAGVLSARIDSIVKADVLPRGFPSLSIVVTRGGQTLLERAWGVANVATGEKAALTTTYNIASMAKQFTAALVLNLVDRGKVSLTDSVGRYLKGLRPDWNAITLEQLLNHTSGLARDFIQEKRAAENLPGDSLVAMAARDTLVSKPGTVYAYSNTGYMLLGVLIEKVHRKPYGAVLRDEIARPLGLTSLGGCETASKGRAAAGYTRFSDGKVGPPSQQHPSQGLGYSSICSTAGDIAKWNGALHGGRVLSPASYAAMTTTRGAATGKYGFGLVPRKAMWASPAVVHDGQAAGFSSRNGWFPAESLSVTLLLNALPQLEVNMADFIGLIALGGTPPPIPPMPVITLPAAATQGEGRPKFVGAYEMGVGRLFIVTFEDAKLFVTPPGGTRQQLFQQSGTAYKLGSPEAKTTITFNIDADGAVTGFTARDNGVDRTLPKVR